MRLLLFTTNTRANGVGASVSKKKMPDITGPTFWALYLRGFKLGKYLFPLLFVLDLFLIIDVLVWDKKDTEKDDDIINHTSMLLYSQLQLPTPASKLAARLSNRNNMMEKLKSYWCGWRNSCYFTKLTEPLIKKFIGE